MKPWNTVAETRTFLARAEKLLTEDERDGLVDYLARNPESGVVIEGTGGVRKLRWALAGRGKSGGVRVIYYFHSDRMPLYLLTVYAKNERADLTMEERRHLSKAVDRLKEAWGL